MKGFAKSNAHRRQTFIRTTIEKKQFDKSKEK